jgi:putative ABC transport system permease protein
MAIWIVSNSFMDAFTYVMEVSYERAQRQDLTIAFFEPRAPEALREVAHLPGVLHVEGERALPVRLRLGHRSYETAIQGLSPDATLRRVVDRNLRPIAVPPDGLVLSTELAKRLDAHPGDALEVEVLEGERPVRRVPVVSLVEEMLGMNAYLDMDALTRLTGEGPRVSGAEVLLDPAREDELFRAVKNLPGIAGATLRKAAKRVFEELTGEMMATTSAILILFASVIAVGVVYNSARITLAERSRELASLRVLGFTRREISTIFLGELGAYLLLAFPFGAAIGYWLTWLIGRTAQNEMYRFPTVIEPVTYLTGAAVVTAASIVTALWVRRRLDRLDLVGVLKTRE